MTRKYYYPKHQYLLFDGRARAGVDTDDLPVLESRDKRPTSIPDDYGEDCIWEELTMIEKGNPPEKLPVYGKNRLMWEVTN